MENHEVEEPQHQNVKHEQRNIYVILQYIASYPFENV